MQDISQWVVKHGITSAAWGDLMAILNPALPELTPAAEKTESGVQTRIQCEAPKVGGALWRNNSGVLNDENGTPVRFGLGNVSPKVNRLWKSSDLIGITPVFVTADMVGKIVGVFTAVEVKKPGWKKPSNERERAQQKFQETVRSLGGIAAFNQSTGDYHTMLKDWLGR